MWIFKRCSFSYTIPLVIRKCPFTEFRFIFSYISFVGLKASLQATQLTPIISNAVVFHGSLASSTFLPQLTTFGFVFCFFLFCFVLFCFPERPRELPRKFRGKEVCWRDLYSKPKAQAPFKRSQERTDYVSRARLPAGKDLAIRRDRFTIGSDSTQVSTVKVLTTSGHLN